MTVDNRLGNVGVDIDGVLANFSFAYAELLTELTGIVFPDFRTCEPTTWYWEREAGIERSRENAVWTKIKENPYFWLDLYAYPEAREFLTRLSRLDPDNVFFVTNRMGVRVVPQTRTWLQWAGYRHRPTVLLSRWKGEMAKSLELTAYIDDKQENCEDVVKMSQNTKCWMLAKPYNTEAQHVSRVESILTFADEVGF